jgi:metal-sulfur cluster biosynthetic enzyme
MNDRKRPMPDDMIDLIEQARETVEGAGRVYVAISEAIDWENAKMEESGQPTRASALSNARL